MATEHDDLDPLEEDLHAAVARDFRTLVNAAARATDDPNASEGWDAVESAIVALFRHIEHVIAGVGEPTNQDMNTVLRTFGNAQVSVAYRMGRMFEAIESALKRRKDRWRRAQTQIRRFTAVVRMYAEMEKGASREHALEAAGLNENSIKQDVSWVRNLLMSGKLGPVPQGLETLGTKPKRRLRRGR
jgi:hypothetical protein